MTKKNKLGPAVLVGLLLSFIIPIMLAQYLFKHASTLHLKTTNKGTLVTPVISPNQLPFKPLINQWSLLYNSESCCDKDCLMNLLVVHQIIKSFGADSSRLRSVLLLPNTCSLRPINQVFSKDTIRTVVILTTPNQPVSAGHSLSKAAQNNLHLATNQLYIIDPHGNLIMFYKKHYNPLDLYTDLSQLLRVSSIG